MRTIDPELYGQLQQLITAMGYELLGCEMQPRGRQMVFRLYIDSEKGVTIDDCSLVSHQVSAMMDVMNPFDARYVLEVSSPGIDRPLFELDHFKKQIGKEVKVRLIRAVNQRKQYKGILQAVEGEEICLLLEDTKQVVRLPFSFIDKANVIGEIHFK
jgi:ribosome maturation factor RimP